MKNENTYKHLANDFSEDENLKTFASTSVWEVLKTFCVEENIRKIRILHLCVNEEVQEKAEVPTVKSCEQTLGSSVNEQSKQDFIINKCSSRMCSMRRVDRIR